MHTGERRVEVLWEAIRQASLARDSRAFEELLGVTADLLWDLGREEESGWCRLEWRIDGHVYMPNPRLVYYTACLPHPRDCYPGSPYWHRTNAQPLLWFPPRSCVCWMDPGGLFLDEPDVQYEFKDHYKPLDTFANLLRGLDP